MNCLTLGRSDDLCRMLILDPYIGYRSRKVLEETTDPYVDRKSKIILQNFFKLPNIDKSVMNITDFASKQKLFYQYSLPKAKYFSLQAKLYYKSLHPKSPVEITQCNRYSLDGQQGVTVKAREAIKKNTIINSISGVYRVMKPYEEKIFTERKTDFSVLSSSRKNCSMLLSGPIACINHDCNPNCEYITLSCSSISVISLKEIKKNEEIYVYYGKDYFGIKNIYCECETCSLKKKNKLNGKLIRLYKSLLLFLLTCMTFQLEYFLND